MKDLLTDGKTQTGCTGIELFLLEQCLSVCSWDNYPISHFEIIMLFCRRAVVREVFGGGGGAQVGIIGEARG